MKYLVTGGAGFIGSSIAETLVRRGHKVRIIDNFCTGKKENIQHFISKIELIRGDIRNEKDLKKAMRGVDYVLHQAALRSVPRSVEDPLSTNDVNITGTLKLLMAAREMKVKRVVYASSSSAYGDCKQFPQKETLATNPISPYAVSKLAAEHYCQVFAKTFGLETVSLRYFNVFGPRQDPNSKYSAVIPKFIFAALKNEPIEIHGDGKQSRDFSYIDNVVEANIRASIARNASGQVFNIACNESHSINEIAKGIEKAIGRKIKIFYAPKRAGDVRKTYADISKAKKLIGYAPKVDFEEGLFRTFKWFAENWEKQ
jgi:UDP-N-acetylglucosamine/UDP-N-acetylgalactosamine 4-epimerase